MSCRPKKKRKSRAEQKSGLPKGGYRLPEGGVMLPSSKPVGDNPIVIRTVMREDPDVRVFARVLMDLAREELKQKEEQDKRQDR